MRLVFDLDQLNALLRDFYTLTHIRITVFDAQFCELTTYPDVHAPVCALIRASEAGRAACCACDRDACTRAASLTDAHVYRCHAGLTEAIMPLRVGDTAAGFLLFGQLLSYESRALAWQAVRAGGGRYSIDAEALERAFQKMPLTDEAYIHAAAHILHAVAHDLILKKMADLKEEGPAEALDAYLRAHFAEPLTAQTLCERLGIGKTRLYALSKRLYGQGVAQQIRRMRVDRAKELLVSQPKMRVREIAFACGFTDYNYFICVFTRLTGLSPARYRQTMLQK